MMIKVANSAIMKDWALVVDLGKEGDAQFDFERPPLSEPLAFFGGHEYGDKTYTNGADRDEIVHFRWLRVLPVLWVHVVEQLAVGAVQRRYAERRRRRRVGGGPWRAHDGCGRAR